MRARLFCVLAFIAAGAVPAHADVPSYLRFDGAIGVDPLTAAGGVETVERIERGVDERFDLASALARELHERVPVLHEQDVGIEVPDEVDRSSAILRRGHAETLGGQAARDEPGGCGLVVGDAQVSELHCNFLINRGNATAADIETLGETVRRRVKETSGIDLDWEIKRIGVPG